MDAIEPELVLPQVWTAQGPRHGEMRISKAPNRRCEIAHRSQALLDGRFDADWLVHGRSRLNEIVLFEDAMVAVARQDHTGTLKVRTEKGLNSLEFVALRPR